MLLSGETGKNKEGELINFFNEKIHETSLEMIKKGELKNEDLLDFIENDDICFNNDENHKKYRPLSIFDGFDLNKINENFYKKWKKVNLFKKYSFLNNNDAQIIMINKINHIKDFGKLLKLFNLCDEKLCDGNTVMLLSEKYIELIKTYTKETCPNFIEETSLLIYMVNKKLFVGKYFIENTIEKYINSPQLKIKIFLYLSSNYKDISHSIVEYITNYIIVNLDNQINILKGNHLLFLLKNINSDSLLKKMIHLLDNNIIKEEEIFNDKKEIDSFILLEGIQKEKLIDKYKNLKESSYWTSTSVLADKISNNLKKGIIKYNIVSSWYENNHKKQLLIEKLKILFIQNEEEVNNCIEAINNYYIKITEIISYKKKVYEFIKKFLLINIQML